MTERQEMNLPVNVRPIYADEANVNANIKINIEKDEDGKEIIRKLGKVDILFFDQFTRSVVSRVIVDPFTAKMLGKILIDNAERVIIEMEKTDIPEEVKRQIKDRENKTKESIKPSFNTYIG